ncbi:MAG TPA: MerR family transcriptional regulator [Jatrophihabitans sp.]|nr:MerR family transcriptional regulator [Jatrophihabitans sp.]
MRISELADRSGLPVATIKFYLRKGLLPPGEPVSKTQADYGESHLQRLRLIRALREIADLPVATIATVLSAVDDEQMPLLELLRVTQTAVARPASNGTDTEPAERLLRELGWQLLPGSALVESLAGVLDALAGQEEKIDTASLKPWAEAAWSVAEVEVGYISAGTARAAAARRVAVGTAIYGELLAQLRLAAQEAVSVSRFRTGAPDAPDSVAVNTGDDSNSANGSPNRPLPPMVRIATSLPKQTQPGASRTKAQSAGTGRRGSR